MFSVLTSKIFGGLSLTLLAALVWIKLSTGMEIASLNRDIEGYQAKIASQQVDLSTLRGNQKGLEAGVLACNTSVDAYKNVVESLAKAGNAALAEVQKGTATLNRRLGAIDAMPAKSCDDAMGILKAGGN